MHVKPSGIVMLLIVASMIFGAVAGWRYFTSPSVADPSNPSLPPYLAKSSKDRYPVYNGPLTETWSRPIALVAGYAPEVLPLEDGALLEVRCNGNDDFVYSKDYRNRIMVKGKQVATFGPAGFHINTVEVRAANNQSIGKPYVVSFVVDK